MKPTSAVITQITQLFSPDNTAPLYHQYKCIQQHGGTNCGIFAIAYAVDLLEGSKPYQFIYDQSKMRQHLIDCFEAGKITSFPKYVIKQMTNHYRNQTVRHQNEYYLDVPKEFKIKSLQLRFKYQ